MYKINILHFHTVAITSVTCVLSLCRNKTKFLQRLLPNENHLNLPRDNSSLFQKLCEVCVWPVEVNWRLLVNVSLQNIISPMPSDKATPIQDILLILFVVNIVVSYLCCVLFYVHGPLCFIAYTLYRYLDEFQF